MNPSDPDLYNQISNYIKSKNPINSAYRSGLIVSLYKKRFEDRYGNVKPFFGEKPKGGLKRWFLENWTNQRGNIGYQQIGDIYRPTYRITEDTPITWEELTHKEIKAAQKEKATKQPVKKFGNVGTGINSIKTNYLSQFIPIQEKKARELGLDFIDRIEVSPIKNKKYRVFLKPNGKHENEYIDYGYYGALSSGKESEDFLEHKDEERRYKFHQRWKNNPNRDNIYSPVFWILRLTW